MDGRFLHLAQEVLMRARPERQRGAEAVGQEAYPARIPSARRVRVETSARMGDVRVLARKCWLNLRGLPVRIRQLVKAQHPNPQGCQTRGQVLQGLLRPTRSHGGTVPTGRASVPPGAAPEGGGCSVVPGTARSLSS